MDNALRHGDVGFAGAPISVLQVENHDLTGDVFLILDFDRVGQAAINVHKNILRRWWHSMGGSVNVSLNELRYLTVAEAKADCDWWVENMSGGYVLVNPGIDSWWPTRERLVPSRSKGHHVRVSSSKPRRNRINASHPFEPDRPVSVVSFECTGQSV